MAASRWRWKNCPSTTSASIVYARDRAHGVVQQRQAGAVVVARRVAPARVHSSRASAPAVSIAPSPRLARPGSTPRMRTLSTRPGTAELPVVDCDPVGVELLGLGVDEAPEHVRPSASRTTRSLQRTDRLAQGRRQLLDLVPAAVAHAHVVDVAGDRRRRDQVALDAVDARGHDRGQREVRVARRVGHAQLAAGADAAPGRDADQGAAVADRPGDVGGRLVAGREPLVAVDQGVGHGHQALGVLEHAGDPVPAVCDSWCSAPRRRRRSRRRGTATGGCACPSR
jgi:hypothetical protein